MSPTTPAARGDRPYDGLDPDAVLSAVEAWGLPCDGRLLALNSYENRVYRVGTAEGGAVVAKFYRPGRWSDAAILEEHAFSAELVEAELPVVAPLVLRGQTLLTHATWRLALYPVIGGRAPEPDDRATLMQLGRTLGRLHAVAARSGFTHRPLLDPQRHGRQPLAELLGGDAIPLHLQEPFARLGELVLGAVEQAWRAVAPATQRIHGDFHLGNLLLQGERLAIVDFDDAAHGPAVQDLWLLLSGEADDMRRQLGWLLPEYARFHAFDPRQLQLVEPLRTLRLLHLHGWIAQRWHDPAFPAAFPWFADESHWQRLIGQLHEQLALLQEPPDLLP